MNWPESIDGQLDDPQTYWQGGGAQRMAAWYDKYGPLLVQYAGEAQAIWRAHGFDVRVDRQESSGLQAGAEGWITKDGITTYWSVGPMTPRWETPAEFAQRIENNWALERAAQVAVGAYAMPSPGPPTTVSAGASIQPVQAPPAPDAGTQVSPPEAAPDKRQTFDQWNWEYKQQTGRDGPAPEAVGFPAERRQEQISRAEWWQYAGPWFSTGSGPAPGAPEPGTGPAPGPNTGTFPGVSPPTNLYSVVAAVLFALRLLAPQR
jgi:hypothetical protein